MAPKRIICVGHAALDRIYRINAFPPEPTKVRALEHVEVGGGMAANAAVAITRLGGTAELWSRTGDDQAGANIRNGLKTERVDIRYVHAFEETRSSTSAIIVDGTGERMIVGMRDAGMPSSTSWLPLERIAGASAVLCDLRWLEATRTVMTRARAEGVPTILDADLGAREALGDLLRQTDYAVFSGPALREYALGADDSDRLRHVMSFGCRYAGVTLGREGYRWLDAAGEGWQPSFPVDVVDTTAAGDAFHGAFALMVASGQPAAECARIAAAVAGLKCTRLGGRAGLPTMAEVETFLAGKANAGQDAGC